MRATQARTALSAPIRLAYGETRWRVPRWRIAPLLSAARRRHAPTSRSPAGAPRRISSGSRPPSRASRRTRTSRSTATGKIVIRPSAPGLQLDVAGDGQGDRGGRVLGDHRRRTSSSASPSPQRTTEIAKTMGITASSRRYTTTYGGTPGRLNNVQLVARADRRHADRAGRHVLVQRHDRRAHGGEGLPGGARDHQRRAPERARRRDLPGLDDRVQRGLRGRPADHRAHEPRALHLPLPARARRDRQLPGPRPEVRQRHGPLAAAADVRRRRLADRQPLRHAGRPPRREHDRSARRDRAACP